MSKLDNARQRADVLGLNQVSSQSQNALRDWLEGQEADASGALPSRNTAGCRCTHRVWANPRADWRAWNDRNRQEQARRQNATRHPGVR